MPPLRELREDIPLLVSHFIAKHKHPGSTTMPEVSPQAMSALKAYHWPGNVRQLENVIQRAFALGAKDVLDLNDLPNEILRQSDRTIAAEKNLNLKEIEKKAIRKALEKTGGNKADAAKLLGVNTTTVYRKMAKYKLHV
jgi:DNA-binding NtrC family response regulator